MARWRDITSYSRNEPQPREPRTWAYGSGPLSFTVTKGHIYHPDQWVMHMRAANVDCHDLKMAATEPAERAQEAAMAEARRIINAAVRALGLPPAADAVDPGAGASTE